MSLSLDPLRPYADLLKALAALLLATLLVGLGWYAGAGKWEGKYDAEVTAHKATKAEHARVMSDLAEKIAAVAAKAKAASDKLAEDRKANDDRYDKAVDRAKRAESDLARALRRGAVQLRPEWTCDSPGSGTGSPAAAAGRQDAAAGLRYAGAAGLIGGADRCDAWIGWLQRELTSTRQAVIAAGCAVEGKP